MILTNGFSSADENDQMTQLIAPSPQFQSISEPLKESFTTPHDTNASEFVKIEERAGSFTLYLLCCLWPLAQGYDMPTIFEICVGSACMGSLFSPFNQIISFFNSMMAILTTSSQLDNIGVLIFKYAFSTNCFLLF